MSTEYLYGCSPEDFCNLIYKDAIKFKKKKASSLAHRLYNELENTKLSYDDTFDLRKRFFEVTKAIHHNKKLLEEL